MGWFYGFKLHAIINSSGELIRLRLTPGNIDDRTPMPDLCEGLFGQLYADKGYIAHWLTETRLKGTRVVVIACEYSATASKADDVLVVRPGTTPALALGFANVILRDKLYDADYVRRYHVVEGLARNWDGVQLQAHSVVKKFKSYPTPFSTRTGAHP